MILGTTPRPVDRRTEAAPPWGFLSRLGLFLVLTGAFTNCYRATGVQRPTALASEIPATGGDRVLGLKAEAGPGDYFLGNDFVELAVDGSPFLERDALAGAPGGGSIVDVGYVGLDTSYHRVSMPSDVLDRMTAVVNQDPDLSLVFDRYLPVNGNSESRIEMDGYLHDPLHKLAGASWDAEDRVRGVSVRHIIRLGKSDRHFLLETTVTNASASSLPIRNIGDLVFQNGSGFRFVVPAKEDAAGNPITNWGAQIPGSSWASPLSSSVKAPLVVMMGSEPGAATVDSHISLGLLPLDGDLLLVGCDAQDALNEERPKVAARLVAGGLPGGGLAAGASLSHNRRLFVVGGSTVSTNSPNQATGILNEMEYFKAKLRGYDTGGVVFSTFGSASKSGPLQAEIRFERNVGSAAAPSWKLERVDWLEPQENTYAQASVGNPFALLPAGTYRIEIRNRKESLVMNQFTNIGNVDRPDLQTPLLVEKNKTFSISEYLAPERGTILNPDGQSVRGQLFTQHRFYARQLGGVDGMFQPLRYTMTGTGGTPDPDIRRVRGLGGTYDPLSKAKVSAASNVGAYHFTAGNGLFGASLSASTPGGFWFPKGNFIASSTRGPLSYLDQTPVSAYDGQLTATHSLLILPSPLPTGWTAFDLPGVSQATGGGLLPAESLASALAENVQVVGATELDLHVDADALRDEFRQEFAYYGTTDEMRAAIKEDPFVIAGRSASLKDGGGASWGDATLLFTPVPTSGRSKGALPSKGWSLADFLVQGQGKYSIIHRPRGPQGLFTLKGFNPAVALGTGVNAWWSQPGQLSQGRAQGTFDALELIRAEGFDALHPDAWFTEFKAVRRDWFALLNQQTPTAFTKGLGLSAARYSLDTPVGLARTYLSIGSATLTQTDSAPVLAALRTGALVASTGPLLDVSLNGSGPGSLVSAAGTVNLQVNLYASDWTPVEELRVVVNGQVVKTVDPATFSAGADWRQRTGTVQVTLPTKDCWIVVEAGVPLSTTGAYRPGSDWNRIQKGIYPIAVTNPIFVDATGGGYTPPGI